MAPTTKKSKASTKCKDIISNMPDAVLHHILSFLDMKYVVRTCVLSRKWTDIWTSVFILNFDYQFYLGSTKSGNIFFDFVVDQALLHLYSTLEKSGNQFVDFVDKVLLRRADNTIRKLQLRVSDVSDASLINKGIQVAMKCNVQEIDLNVREQHPFPKLPLWLFPCESVRELKLTHGFGFPSVDLKLPRSSSFPRLQTLHLNGVRFSNEKPTFEPFSSCQVLETLILDKCAFWNMKCITISSHRLKKLVIKHIQNEYNPADLDVKVSAPCLESFRCKDLSENVYSLDKLGSLLEADIDTVKRDIHLEDLGYESDDGLYRKKKQIGHGLRIISFLREVSSTKALTLPAWSVQYLSEVLDVLEETLGTFHNLRYLKLTAFCTFPSFRSVICLLKSLSNLETFVMRIKKDYCPTVELAKHYFTNLNSEEHREQLKTEISSEHILPELKSIEMREFLGCEDEFNLLKFVLKNAMNLEKVIVIVSEELIRDQSIKVYHERLMKFPRASPTIAIFFSFETVSKVQSS